MSLIRGTANTAKLVLYFRNSTLSISISIIAETRLTSKELPTTKWRRERRHRAAAVDYQVHDAGGSSSSNSSEREREREREREPDMDSPIDMSVTSSTVKHQRASPPPPYREPLAGISHSSASSSYAASRPSVITQAPPKREQPEHLHAHSHAAHSSREQDNRSTGKFTANPCQLVNLLIF